MHSNLLEDLHDSTKGFMYVNWYYSNEVLHGFHYLHSYLKLLQEQHLKAGFQGLIEILCQIFESGVQLSNLVNFVIVCKSCCFSAITCRTL